MRTTITIDDDIAVRIERLRTGQRKSLKAVINDVLRRGLTADDQVREPRADYHTRTVNTGRCRLPNLDNVSEALDFAEGDNRP